MEAIKTKGISTRGLLTIQVPKEFDDRELEVIILSPDRDINDINTADIRKQLHEEKVQRLMSIVGKAKYPDFPISKYDVYDQ